MFCHEIGCRTEVLVQKGGVIVCCDDRSEVGPEGKKPAFVNVRSEDHGHLGTNGPRLSGYCGTIDVWLEINDVNATVDDIERLQRCRGDQGLICNCSKACTDLKDSQ